MFTAIFQGAVAAALAAGASDIDSTKSRVDVLGLQVCMEEPHDGLPCHVPDDVTCDVRLSPDPETHGPA
jgi:hypothetical protein